MLTNQVCQYQQILSTRPKNSVMNRQCNFECTIGLKCNAVSVSMLTLLLIFLILSCTSAEPKFKANLDLRPDFRLDSVLFEEKKIIAYYSFFNTSDSCLTYILPREDSISDYPLFDINLIFRNGFKLHVLENTNGRYEKLKFEFIPSNQNTITLSPSELYNGNIYIDLDENLYLDTLSSIEVIQNDYNFSFGSFNKNCSFQNFHKAIFYF